MENDASRPARILVFYHSEGGHTKAMADDLVWCGGIAVGSPTHMGTIAWEMKHWWDVTAQPLWPKIEGKIGCAFSSTGGAAGGGELTCLALQIVLMNYGVPDYVAPGQTLH